MTVILGVYSCKKENLQVKDTPNEQCINAEGLALINKIEAFKASLNKKSTETMGISEVLWNIEAAMNYTYGVLHTSPLPPEEL